MHSGYSDITLREYSTDTLSLIVDNESEKTRLITDKTSLEDNTVIRVGTHRLYIGKARKSNGAIVFFDGSPTYPGGSVKLFYGDTLILENGRETTEKTVLGVLGNRVLFEGGDTVYLDVEKFTLALKSYRHREGENHFRLWVEALGVPERHTDANEHLVEGAHQIEVGYVLKVSYLFEFYSESFCARKHVAHSFYLHHLFLPPSLFAPQPLQCSAQEGVVS
jgi:hypothetical protein